jgi:hypothetical protein
MQLTIEGVVHSFIPLTVFRARWNLPDDFTLARFEPKDWTVGSMEGAGRSALTTLRQSVITALPHRLRLAELMPLVEALINLFHQGMITINPQVGLRQVEIEFAVAGFADVTRSAAYQLIQLGYLYPGNPEAIRQSFNFAAIYQEWLDASTRLADKIYTYTWQGQQFEVQTIYNPYGRVGMKVHVANEDYYVTDMTLACPAASFMYSLCHEVAQGLGEALEC